MTQTLRLYKKEKLCSKTAVDALFVSSKETPESVSTLMAYPWRVIWRLDTSRVEGAKFLISVPKRRLRHAIDRVTMRRRCREAYRLSRNIYPFPVPAVDIAFVYVADRPTSYQRTHASVNKILTSIISSLAEKDI